MLSTKGEGGTGEERKREGQCLGRRREGWSGLEGGGVVHGVQPRHGNGGGGLKRRHIMAGLSKGGVGSKSRPVAGIVAKIVGTARDVLWEAFINRYRGIDVKENCRRLRRAIRGWSAQAAAERQGPGAQRRETMGRCMRSIWWRGHRCVLHSRRWPTESAIVQLFRTQFAKRVDDEGMFL